MKNGAPESSIDVLMSSLNENTRKQYNTTFKKWWDFCGGTMEKVLSLNVRQTIEFLNQEFNSGAKYGTINCHKSALSLIFAWNDKESRLVNRFIKGVFKIRPTFPRYTETWDPQPALSHLGKMFPLRSLSLEQLTKKLILLLALASGQRAQTFAKIKLQDIKKYDDRIEITITEILKTSAANKPQPKIILPSFQEKVELCIATTILFYIQKTEHIRGKNHNYLLLTHKKPHHTASTQTVSRWIKEAMTLCGIDTDIFKSHSTRHAATSAGFRSGISIEKIREAAGWTQKSQSFAKFYNRPLRKTECLANMLEQ